MNDGFYALTQLCIRMGNAPSGRLAAGDPLSPLLVWHDRNHDGVSDRAELRRAADLFTQLPLGYWAVEGRQDEHGNVFRFGGHAEIRTAPDQGVALNAKDHEERLRPMFEVALAR